MTATPRVPDWKWQIWPAKFGQSAFPWFFFNISYLCCWISRRTFLNSRSMKELQNLTLFSHLVISHALKKVLKTFLKKLVIPLIQSCLRIQLNHYKKYEVTISETIILRYISSVFVALNLWKTPPVGEIWVDIHTIHFRSSGGTKTAHEWVALIVWLFDLYPRNCWFSLLSHDSPHTTIFWPQKIDSGWKPKQSSIKNWATMAIFNQEPMGSPFQNIFKPDVFQSD